MTFLRWLCRVCDEQFDSEIRMAAHIRETGHAQASLRRVR